MRKTQHVLAVNDLDAAEAYFIDKLGFTLKARIGGWSFLNLDEFHLMVGHCEGEMLARDTRNHSYFAYVNCRDIDALYAQYLASGAEFTQPIADKPWGLREFGVVTPEGHRIMFGQPIDEPVAVSDESS
ncbi:MAG TPA: VOC family protein [Polyangiaceae bacterium]|nr:VOC family protein [Polyangiaceae bacterium]